jgi:hypothetical protein
MMPEILTESFCERCGTRYTFESAAPTKTKRLGRFKTTAKGLKNYVMSDDTSLDEAMAAARSDDEREQTSQQLDAFHSTFNFCMNCRQYTCGNCWNEVEGRCLTCAPNLGHEIMPAPFPELPVATAPIELEAWPESDLPAEAAAAAIVAEPLEEIDVADRLDRLSAPHEDAVPTWLAAAEADALASANLDVVDDATDAREDVAEPASAPMAWPAEVTAAADGPAIVDEAAVVEAGAVELEASIEAAPEPPPAVDEPPEAVPAATEGAEPAAAAGIAAAALADVGPETAEPVAAQADTVATGATADGQPDEVEDRAAAAALATTAILSKFRPGQSIDAELEAYEAAVAASEAAVSAKIRKTRDPATEVAAPEPLAPAAEATPAAPSEPEPLPAAAATAEDAAEPAAEPVADSAAAELVAEPADAEVVAEPPDAAADEDRIAAAAATAAAAASVTSEAPRTDVVEQPTWRIVAPDTTAPATNGHTPEPLPAAATAIPPAPLPGPDAPPQWPTSPAWPEPNPALLAQRPVAPSAAMEALWVASARDVVAPAPGGAVAVGGVQPCNSCGLSLSANARFCRRCGTRQG